MFIWKDVAQQDHVENKRTLEATKDPNRKDFFEGTADQGSSWNIWWSYGCQERNSS